MISVKEKEMKSIKMKSYLASTTIRMYKILTISEYTFIINYCVFK